MPIRLSLALVVAALLSASVAPHVHAQTVVRFETSVGAFDMVLNPTNNPLLEGHVDNMLRYVEAKTYRGSWINRAPEGFVLQMGGFFSHTTRPVHFLENTSSVTSFDPIPGAPASDLGLSNTVGTVALAIPGNNIDGGSGSFFINLGNNSSLDPQFSVFAAIPDMTVINEIMALSQVDIRDEVGTDPGNVHFQDIPVTAEGKQVFINRAFVVNDSLAIARALGGVGSVMAASMGDGSGGESLPLVSGGAVPEPATITLLLLAGLAALGIGRSRRS